LPCKMWEWRACVSCESMLSERDNSLSLRTTVYTVIDRLARHITDRQTDALLLLLLQLLLMLRLSFTATDMQCLSVAFTIRPSCLFYLLFFLAPKVLSSLGLKY